jgi:WhiB family redox-sensing transcriptional regulator
VSSWRSQAACRSASTSLFFPARGDAFSGAVARQLCKGCPVRGECLDYALGFDELVGIFGGTSEAQRRRLRVARSA